MAQNKAAFLDQKGQIPLRIGDAEMYKPAAHEILVKNHAIAINPVDWKVQDSGMFVQKWPMVLGCDVAGVVESVGSNVTAFQPGDRVFGHATSLMDSEPQHGGFNLYTCINAVNAAKIPSSITFNQAAVMPLAVDTAMAGLHGPDPHFGLPYPSLEPKDTGKTIVVWGGSSSVGSATIQLAVASGVKVVATASSHNVDFCKGCGAAEVVDYKSSSVEDDVLSAVKKVGGELVGIYDAIAIPEQSTNHCLSILEKVGGGKIAAVLPLDQKTFPKGVTGQGVFGCQPDLVAPVWKDYLPKALEQGKLKCLPEPIVAGKGFEELQKALDMNKKGVSAKKVVLEL